jgi:hypothetical protein
VQNGSAFFCGHDGFLAKAKPLPLLGFLVDGANCLKTIDYGGTKVRLALLLLNGFCRENPPWGDGRFRKERGL